MICFIESPNESESVYNLSSFNCLSSSVESRDLTTSMEIISNLMYLANMTSEPAEALKYVGMAKAQLRKIEEMDHLLQLN